MDDNRIHPTWNDRVFWQWVAMMVEQHKRAIAKLAAKQKARKEARNADDN